MVKTDWKTNAENWMLTVVYLKQTQARQKFLLKSWVNWKFLLLKLGSAILILQS